MKTLQWNRLRGAIAAFVFASSPAVFIPQSTFAQITPDATLPNPSVVTGNPLFTITGGTTANNNLFHSFSQFSVPTGSTAFFNNALSIQNILVRVTGSSISNIDGTIQASGSANLFLLNPNGIIFGQNASLNIGGSFLGTTANSVRFLDGTEFRANASTQITSPLLLVSVPSGLQFSGLTNGAITAQGNGNGLDFAPPTFLEILRSGNPSLNVSSGRTLAIVGGDVTLTGANLTADSGRIELGSVQGNGFVGITQTASGWLLNYDNAPNLGNIRLEQAAMADTSGNAGGSIQVQGRQVTLNDGSVLLSSTLGSGNGGEIFVRAIELLAATGESTVPFPGGIFTDTGSSSTGNGSNITIATNRLELTNGAQISAGVLGTGNAGNIKINANDISLSGISNSNFYVSGVFSQVLDTGVTGNSGDIQINTNNLQISNGAQLTNLTFGIGNTGKIDIAAKNINLIGTSTKPTGIANAVQFGATGNGNILNIATDNLSILNGAQISVGTAGSGNAGLLLVTAKTIDIAGQVTRGRSGLFANAIFDTGNGGNIVVNSDRLSVRDGGIISASNFPSVAGAPAGTGLVGNITINTPSILLDNGRINIDSAGGNRGNINLNSQLIVLRNGSLISTNALGSAIGGNIAINTNFLVAVPTENSDITANAANSFGGQIIITAQGVIGFQTSNVLTPLSDITATSALGSQFNGTVEILSPENNLSRGLVKLPTDLTSDKQIAASCERFRGNEFIVTGRGGVPNDATQPLASNSIWRDLRWSRLQAHQSSNITKTANIPSESPAVNSPSISNAVAPFPQIEAQGWESDRNGHLKLLASATTSSIPAWRLPVVCPTK
ncbi:two-partner secretion domain-containing protein [Pseudanabaena yagii]|uniref:Filamentous hemagglutinin N-terminal domain-containing protein n=1 Tax=Pseudanabaena yagii GIHE-NHR1 TaxID=2722753 RepID=A0ABX1LXI9_9CYAN|nr:filamentous hemagglutinin N-terminal domain-containing protein [Pseudanabaena yagii]NMF59489.1 filamentous hemagglutinin N-terminal domain-containing protein [Pseudanabaena yagii GIHE-NHR1]